MADYINFDEGVNALIATGLPATLFFELVDEAVSAMAVTDTLASMTQTAATSTKSQAEPTPAGRVVIFSAMTWTETAGSPKAVRMMTTARGGGGKVICAWNLNAGAAINLATAAPLTVDLLAFKLAYLTEP